MIYLLIYFSSSLFSYLAQSQFRVGRRNIAIVFSICAVLLPSIFAGLRDISVGTDNIVYESYFNSISESESLNDAFNNGHIVRASVEPLYVIFNYLISIFTTDYHWVAFSASLITVVFVYLGAYYFRDRIPMWLIMLTFFLTEFGNTWNIVRQGIALSIVFFALQYLEKRKILKYFCWIIMAIGFHSSAFVALFLGISVIFMMRGTFTIRALCVLFGSIIIILFYGPLVELYIGFRPSLENYREFIEYGVIPFSFSQTLVRVPFLILSTIFYKNLVVQHKMNRQYYILLWLEIIIVQMATFFAPIYRMGLYFGYIKLLLIPSIVKVFMRKNNNIVILYISIMGLIIYWYFYTVLNFYGFEMPIYPYKSDILGI